MGTVEEPTVARVEKEVARQVGQVVLAALALRVARLTAAQEA